MQSFTIDANKDQSGSAMPACPSRSPNGHEVCVGQDELRQYDFCDIDVSHTSALLCANTLYQERAFDHVYAQYKKQPGRQANELFPITIRYDTPSLNVVEVLFAEGSIFSNILEDAPELVEYARSHGSLNDKELSTPQDQLVAIPMRTDLVLTHFLPIGFRCTLRKQHVLVLAIRELQCFFQSVIEREIEGQPLDQLAIALICKLGQTYSTSHSALWMLTLLIQTFHAIDVNMEFCTLVETKKTVQEPVALDIGVITFDDWIKKSSEGGKSMYRGTAFEKLMDREEGDMEYVRSLWNAVIGRVHSAVLQRVANLNVTMSDLDPSTGWFKALPSTLNIRPILACIGWSHSSEARGTLRTNSLRLLEDPDILYEILFSDEMMSSECKVPIEKRPGWLGSFVISPGHELEGCEVHYLLNQTVNKGERMLVLVRGEKLSRGVEDIDSCRNVSNVDIEELEEARCAAMSKEGSNSFGRNGGYPYVHIPPYGEYHYHVISRRDPATVNGRETDGKTSEGIFHEVITDDVVKWCYNVVNGVKGAKNGEIPTVSTLRLAPFPHNLASHNSISYLYPLITLAYVQMLYKVPMREDIFRSNGKAYLKSTIVMGKVRDYFYELVASSNLVKRKGKMAFPTREKTKDQAILLLWCATMQHLLRTGRIPVFTSEGMLAGEGSDYLRELVSRIDSDPFVRSNFDRVSLVGTDVLYTWGKPQGELAGYDLSHSPVTYVIRNEKKVQVKRGKTLKELGKELDHRPSRSLNMERKRSERPADEASFYDKVRNKKVGGVPKTWAAIIYKVKGVPHNSSIEIVKKEYEFYLNEFRNKYNYNLDKAYNAEILGRGNLGGEIDPDSFGRNR